MSRAADMAVIVITQAGNSAAGLRFHYSHQNNSQLGFPVSSSGSSGMPLTREELKKVINTLIDECMPEV
jgi:hypothetical protein